MNMIIKSGAIIGTAWLAYGKAPYILMYLIYFLLALIGAGEIILQIYLSRKESARPGLVIPLISFAIAVVMSLISAFLAANINATAAQITAYAFNVFLFYNAPTAVLLLLYAVCRRKRNKKQSRALRKMNAQDLE